MRTREELKRKIILFLFVSLISLAGVFIFHQHPFKEADPNSHTQKKFEKVLRDKEQKLQSILENILNEKNENLPFLKLHPVLQTEIWQKEGLTVFLYRNDSLIFWSDNNVPADDLYDDEAFSSPFKKYGNGWFRILTVSRQNYKAVGLILVKNDFPYQNEYLVNNFQDDFDLPVSAQIDTIPGRINIQAEDGKFLFSVNPVKTGSSYKTELITFFLWIIFIISTVILLFYLYHLFDFITKRPFLLLLAFTFDAILFRFILLYFEIPSFLYDSDLFSPFYFATSFISPSLGDLFINSLFWLTLAVIFFNHCRLNLEKYSYKLRIIMGSAISLFSGFLFFLLINTLKRLVIDSNIELNLNNIFSLDFYSILGFLTMTTLTMAFFLVSSSLFVNLVDGKVKTWHAVLIVIGTVLLSIPFFLKNAAIIPGLIYPAMLLVCLLSYIYFAIKPGGYRNLTGVLFFIILFSIITTYVLDFYHYEKEKETRKIKASELFSRRDPLMEFEFQKLSGQITTDQKIVSMLEDWKKGLNDGKPVDDYIRKNYFINFWNQYDLQVTICKREDVLNIQPGGYLENCYSYFNKLAKLPGTETVSQDLFFVSDKMGNSNYFSELTFHLQNNRSDSARIYIEIFQKYISETGLGYPDLLIDEKAKVISGLDDYSYARYVDDKLIYKNGDFSYNLGFQAFNSKNRDKYFLDNEGYNHYIIKMDDSNALIISKKNMSLLDLIAPFSYLFILFSLFLILFFLGYVLWGGVRQVEFNFSNQLQVAIISIIVISFFILGMITRANIIHLYNNKNRDSLSEKAFSILSEVEHKIGGEPDLYPELQPYVSDMLTNFSSIFYSDINLFNTDGTLFASSRPQIFNEKLLSFKMNPEAYYRLSVEQSLLYLQNEKIGGQEYLSAYIPFRNNEDHIIAYINLPYFAKQTELKKELGDFLAAYINVYVLLIVLAIVVTILVSRIISRPLKLIRDKLSATRLGESNEKIEWNRKDEIGKLVEEYNRMIDELSRSAELLARSERESAWREMAKQVAHEIKNPLTPMKLSVQYLQKAWNEKTPDWEAHLDRFTRTIVEQIDSLSEIASEFSDFAKMPAAYMEKTSLVEVINSATDLYHHRRNISISLEDPGSECFVLADKKQLLRVFNNLVQNAVQAIGKREDGIIRIRISREDENYHIAITDNGMGITDEQAERIFSPSFTTKSSGMGLGLAMSKSILTSINASINFESTPGEGTTFHIIIPAIPG